MPNFKDTFLTDPSKQIQGWRRKGMISFDDND